MKIKKKHNYVNLIFYISVILYLLIHIVFWNHFFNPEFGADQRVYWNLGYYLSQNVNYLWNPVWCMQEIYVPLIIAVLINIFGTSYISIFLYNISLFIVTLTILFKVIGKYFDNYIWALIFILFIITNNTFIKYNFSVARETSTFSFLILSLITGYMYIKSKKRKWLFILGILSGLLVFNDNRYFLHLLIMGVIWFMYLIIHNYSKKDFLLFLILLFFITLPVTVRQYFVLGYPLPVSGWRLELITSEIPQKYLPFDKYKLKLWSENADKAGMKGDSSLLNDTSKLIIRDYYDKYADPKNHALLSREEYYRQKEINDKKNKLHTYFDYFIYFWKVYHNEASIGPGKDYRIYPRWSFITTVNELAHTALLIPFFLIAIFFSLKQKKYFILVMIIIIITHTIFHVITGFHLIRYRYHIMILYTFVGVYGIKEFYYLLFAKNQVFRNIFIKKINIK